MLTTEEKKHRIALTILSVTEADDKVFESLCDGVFDAALLSSTGNNKTTLTKAFRDSTYASNRAKAALLKMNLVTS